MLRSLGKIFGLTFLLLISTSGMLYYQYATSQTKKIEQLEDQKRQLETGLCKDSWKLYEDEAYRKSKGVRALGGHDLCGPFKPERIYTITLESTGGLNMVSAPLKGIYREALKQRGAQAVAN